MFDLTTRDVLAALKLPGLGPAAGRQLIAFAKRSSSSPSPFGNLVEVLESLPLRKPSVPFSDEIEQAYLAADVILQRSERLGITTLSALDADFPEALLDLADYPPVLYVKGDLQAVRRKNKLAVVGSREASELGLRLARKIASELSARGVCVVSGLALGVDAAAHQGALTGAGSTIAVLAHGLDQVAPKSHTALAEAILEHGGALVSDYEIGTPPRPPQFVFRNRLQSGLGYGSVVVESGFTGGSIHQGNFTKKQRRLLFVVRPDPNLPGVQNFRLDGADRLMAEFGATPISKFGDLLHAIPAFNQPIIAASGDTEPSPSKDNEGASRPHGSGDGPSQGGLFE